MPPISVFAILYVKNDSFIIFCIENYVAQSSAGHYVPAIMYCSLWTCNGVPVIHYFVLMIMYQLLCSDLYVLLLYTDHFLYSVPVII